MFKLPNVVQYYEYMMETAATPCVVEVIIVHFTEIL
jgi:hypothetical protein